MDVTINKESVTGAVRMVGAVGKVGLEMDVMELLGGVTVINANFIQVCMLESIYKSHYNYQNFPPLANGTYVFE